MASAGTVVDASGGVLVSIPVISKAKIQFTKQIIVKAKEECLAPKKYEKIKKTYAGRIYSIYNEYK